MRYTELTSEQELEIANRLGITKPEAPQEVADYYQLLKQYETMKDDLRLDGIGWRATPSEALEILDGNHRQITALTAVIGKILDTPETIKLAFTAYQDKLNKYEIAIRTEQERPEKEFLNARDNYRETLNKEIHATKNKLTRLTKDRDKQEYQSETWKALNGTIATLSARLDLISLLEMEAAYLGYKDGLEFSPELVASKLDKTRENIKRALEALNN